MIPIRDTITSETYPIVNSSLIAINVLVFLFESSVGGGFNRFIFTYGLVPARYSVQEFSDYFSTGHQIFSFFSFMFLHGGFFHLLGNMWTLYIFGDNVEDRLGHGRYLVFYLLCGLASGLSHIALNFYSEIPTVGASGAIAGVMGAYFILYPRAKVLTLVPIFFFIHFVELPAFFFLGIWFLIQFMNAAGRTAEAGGIAWWAHIGGFIFGIILLKLMDFLPHTSGSGKLKNITRKRSTPRLQMIRPSSVGSDSNLYGVVTLNEREALFGTRKLINIAEGFGKRSFLVTIPPGAKEGSKLRLRGMGRRMDDSTRGDLYLKIHIKAY